MAIDINREDYYRYDKPELRDRTKSRLALISAAGMEEVGIAEFGVRGIVSGLYIEKVWSDSAEDFAGYLEWAKDLIAQKQQ